MKDAAESLKRIQLKVEDPPFRSDRSKLKVEGWKRSDRRAEAAPSALVSALEQ